MPVLKVKGGWKVQNVPKVHKTKAAAVRQLRAVKASQKRRIKRRDKR